MENGSSLKTSHLNTYKSIQALFEWTFFIFRLKYECDFYEDDTPWSHQKQKT